MEVIVLITKLTMEDLSHGTKTMSLICCSCFPPLSVPGEIFPHVLMQSCCNGHLFQICNTRSQMTDQGIQRLTVKQTADGNSFFSLTRPPHSCFQSVTFLIDALKKNHENNHYYTTCTMTIYTPSV